ncbi:MAG TPA: TetR/AcrR family transcriptional regulator [Acidimicrobiales bacterium]|nr:TetR/AcrR family transcriptional regulator [Acidimicrobiales bacterium]
MGPGRASGARPGRDGVSPRQAKGATDGKKPPTRQARAPRVTGEPASRRALRSQGRKTMRKLLDAAMVVFARRGYHAARVDDIVKVARTSHGTFYLYFSNKEDLLRALVAEAGEVVAALDDALGPVGPDAAGWQELRVWMERFSDAWQRYAPVLRAWTDLVVSDTELSAQARAAAGGVARTLVARIDESGPHPGIDAVAAAEAVVAMVDRFHYLRQFAGEPVDASAIDTLTTMVHRALFGGGVPPEDVLWSSRAGARGTSSR